MKPFRIKRFASCTSLFTIGLIISWLIPNVFILSNLKKDNSIDLTDKSIFLNIMGSHCNYLSYNRIMVLYLLVFIFIMNYYSFSEKPAYVIRLQLRKAFIKKRLIDVVEFSLVLAFLIEIINIVFSFVYFGSELTIQSNLILYSVFDFITETIFYIRAGEILLLAVILTNRRIAPFLTFAIYFLEYFAKDYLSFSGDLWLPYLDSVQVTKLIMKSVTPLNLSPIIIRGFAINLALAIAAYSLFKRKDIISHEKK